MLNLTANYCLLSKTPAGSLRIAGSTSGAFSPTGAILPFAGPESEYFAPVNALMASQTVLSSGVTGALPPPMPLLAPHLYTLGFGLDEQDAQVVAGSDNNFDSLGFYLTTTPAAGTRIQFRSNEAQRAISHVVDADAVAAEAALVGDDGRRIAIVTDMSPLPRTSEDCDAAGQAYLDDHDNTLYNGTYVAESDLINPVTEDDIAYWPVPGRMLEVNCPARNLNDVAFLVSQVTTSVLDPVTNELFSHSIQFGADTRTEKLLANFTASQPDNVFTPKDSAAQPTGQTLAAMVTGGYLPDIVDTELSFIKDTQAIITIQSPYLPKAITDAPLTAVANAGRIVGGVHMTSFSVAAPDQSSGIASIGPATVSVASPTPDTLAGLTVVEVRLSDQNWGQNTANLVARTTSSSVPLTKNNYDQTWYLRIVQFDDNAQPYMVSRRSKVVRVRYPLRPAAPSIIYGNTMEIQLDFAGDQRNIYGIEVRSGDDKTVLFQQSANDTTDMYFNLQQYVDPLNTIATGLTASQRRVYIARFFNLQWLYSEPTQIMTPPPPAPVISVGVRFSQMVQVRSDTISRTDIQYQTLEVSYDNFQNVVNTIKSSGQPGSWAFSVPSTQDVYVRSKRFDYVGESPYSNIVKIPQGDLIASDYLATQGSVPPVVTSNATGLFSYEATATSITIHGVSFSIKFPNGAVNVIPAVSQSYTTAFDAVGNESPLQSGKTYSYFPRVIDPFSADAQTEIGSLYTGVSTDFIASLVQDGSVLLSGSSLSVTTAATATGTTGGNSGGGTGGGGGGGNPGTGACVEESEFITMADTSVMVAQRLLPGHLCHGANGEVSRIKSVTHTRNVPLVRVTTESGRVLCCTEAHALKSAHRWCPVLELQERLSEGETLYVGTIDGPEKLLSVEPHGHGHIVALKMVGRNKTYYANGFESHNLMFKNEDLE